MPESESFDVFYRDTRQRLFDGLVALAGNRAEAQDIVHEAYARAWQRWGAVGQYADPEAWVRTVARRLAVSRWRRARSALRAYQRVGVAQPCRQRLRRGRRGARQIRGVVSNVWLDAATNETAARDLAAKAAARLR